MVRTAKADVREAAKLAVAAAAVVQVAAVAQSAPYAPG
jgi:hypothetical protein